MPAVGMLGEPVRWSDEVDEVIKGRPRGCRLHHPGRRGRRHRGLPGEHRRCEEGEVGLHTSLGFPNKLERIIANPHMTLAGSPAFVLIQGLPSVDIRPSRERIEAFIPTRNATWDT
jgi:hypothetical protein